MVIIVSDQIFQFRRLRVPCRFGFGGPIFMERRQRTESFRPLIPVDRAQSIDHWRDFFVNCVEKWIAIFLGPPEQLALHFCHRPRFESTRHSHSSGCAQYIYFETSRSEKDKSTPAGSTKVDDIDSDHGL